MSPIHPNPHSALMNMSSSCSLETRTTWIPSVGKTKSRKVTIVLKLPKSTPDPCVAVEMAPARAWSEMEPREEMERPCFARRGCRFRSLIPPSMCAIPVVASTYTDDGVSCPEQNLFFLLNRMRTCADADKR